VSMLDRYIGECMISIIKINNGIKEPIYGYQNCNTTQILIFGGYVKVRESVIYMNSYLGEHQHSEA
jgi:hypothetical protein